MLEHGMPVEPDNYAALYVCVNNQAADIAKLLLDKGIDLDRYQAWAEKQRKNEGYEETMAELTENTATAAIMAAARQSMTQVRKARRQRLPLGASAVFWRSFFFFLSIRIGFKGGSFFFSLIGICSFLICIHLL